MKERVSSIFGTSLSATLDEIDWKLTLAEKSKDEIEESSCDEDSQDGLAGAMNKQNEINSNSESHLKNALSLSGKDKFSAVAEQVNDEETFDTKSQYQSQKDLLQSLSYQSENAQIKKNNFAKEEKMFTVSIKGLLTSPNAIKREGKKGNCSSANNKVYLYINSRFVDSPMLTKAFTNSFRYVCFLNILL